jgi:flagellar assembly protein FliH
MMRSSSRIIRGEEAQRLESWSVDSIGSSFDNKVDRLLEELAGELLKRPIVPPPLTEAEQALNDREQALNEREAALTLLEQKTLHKAEEMGQQRGYEAGWNAAHQERIALEQAATSLTEQFETFKNGLSTKLLDLAIAISRKVIADTLELHPEAAAIALKELINSMQLDTTAIVLRAHPQTVRLLEAQLGNMKDLAHMRILEDKNQLQGGFILQHPEGEIDASVESRWLRTIEALGKKTPLESQEE